MHKPRSAFFLSDPGFRIVQSVHIIDDVEGRSGNSVRIPGIPVLGHFKGVHAVLLGELFDKDDLLPPVLADGADTADSARIPVLNNLVFLMLSFFQDQSISR